MKDLFTKVKTFILDEEGASAVEYGLLVALIAVAIITAVSLLGTKLSGTFTNVANEIGKGAGGGS
uniref:Flp family type IVb pilin n=1 Tax=Desulfobacca acetoxidans TaxID=60893 RepID=A0A7C5AMR9_9BACT